MTRRVPTEPHVEELAFEPTREALAERGAALRQEIGAVRESVAAIDGALPDTLDDVATFTPEQYDALRERLNGERAALETRIATLETARAQLLADWEAVAVDTLGAHTNITVPDATIVLGSTSPLAQIDAGLRERSHTLARAGVFTRLFSRAHLRASEQLAAHERIMEQIRAARAEVVTSTTAPMDAHRKDIATTVAAVQERLRVQLIDAVDEHIQSITRREQPLQELAGDPAFFDRIQARIHAEVIAPLLEQARGEEPTPERDALIAEWSVALNDLLAHARNESVPHDERDQSPEAPPWRQAWNYGARARELERAIRESFPHHPFRSWEKTFPADEDRDRAIADAEATINKDPDCNLRTQTGDLVALFSEWRTRRAWETTIEPYRRDATEFLIDRAQFAMRGDAARWWEDLQQLSRRIIGIRYWRMLSEDPAFAAQSTPEECAAFEDGLVETLVRDVLRPGRHESDAGTRVVFRLRELDNPRALPLLLEHVRYSGTGHTNAEVYGALVAMANTPHGRAFIATLPAVERRLFDQILDPASVLNTECGTNVYYKTLMLSRGEVFLGRAALAHCFSAERDSSGKASVREQFLAGSLRTDEAIATLRPQRDAVERAVLAMDDCAPWWSVAGLSEFLAERPAFTQSVIDSMSGITPDHRTRFGQLLDHKRVQASAQTRSAITEGMLALRTAGETGSVLLGAMLDRYQGSKDDPGRVRKLFRYFELLHRFGALSSEYDPAARMMEIDSEIAALRERAEAPRDRRNRLYHQQLAVAHSREALAVPAADGFSVEGQIAVLDAELTSIDASLVALGTELDPIEARINALAVEREHHVAGGLQGFVDHYQHRVTSFLTERLGVDADTAERITADIDAHLASGLIDIATTLLLSYEGKHVERPTVALREVVAHIATGDAVAWKYTHEIANTQIGFLSSEARAEWRKNADPVTVDSTKEAIGDAARPAAQRLFADAVRHAQESEETHARAVAAGREPPPDSEGGESPRNPEQLAAQLDAIGAALERPSIDLSSLRAAVDAARDAAAALGHSQVIADLEQVLLPFQVGAIGVVRAEEFDDPIRLLKIGTEPTETCQSWKRGQYNECLLAYVVDGNVKGLNVLDDRGQVMLRCVERAVPSRELSSERTDPPVRATIFLEPSYALLEHPSVYRALARLVLPKAIRMGAFVQLTNLWPDVARDVFAEEAKKLRMTWATGYRAAQLHPSFNEVVYSDSFGGKITPHGDFVAPSREVVEFAPPERAV